VRVEGFGGKRERIKERRRVGGRIGGGERV
jgi:hypothetical protein